MYLATVCILIVNVEDSGTCSTYLSAVVFVPQCVGVIFLFILHILYCNFHWKVEAVILIIKFRDGNRTEHTELEPCSKAIPNRTNPQSLTTAPELNRTIRLNEPNSNSL